MNSIAAQQRRDRAEELEVRAHLRVRPVLPGPQLPLVLDEARQERQARSSVVRRTADWKIWSGKVVNKSCFFRFPIFLYVHL